MIRASLLALGLALIVGGGAGAQEAISTATGAPGDGAPAASATAPLHLAERLYDSDNIVRSVGPCGAPVRSADGKPDRRPHGEVFAGVGTHGYREAGGVVCAPIGDHASATIAVDVGRINARTDRRR